MQLLSSILLLSCFVSIALAAPVLESQQKRQPGSFKVERVRNPHYEPDGPAELKRAYGKYGFNMPRGSDHKLAARAGNETGKVPNTPVFRDREFLSPVTIGGQGFLLNFDTGSSDLWVFSTQQPPEQTAGHKVFDPAKSPTFEALPNHKFAVSYGDGSFALGVVGTDTVEIGGATVESQAVELAVNVSESFVNDVASQGLVGLAFSNLNRVNPTKQKTFLDNILPSLKAPVLTADLRRGAPGTYEFGNIDSSLFVGDLTFTNVNTTRGFWGFNPSKFVVNGQDVTLTDNSAIADTGTTLMLVDPALAEAYYAGVNGAGESLDGFVFPCGQTLPDMGVEIEGKTFTIPGSLINFGKVTSNGNTCFGGIQTIPKPPMIFGDVFFKAMFVAFDAGDPPRLGFGERDFTPPGSAATKCGGQ